VTLPPEFPPVGHTPAATRVPRWLAVLISGWFFIVFAYVLTRFVSTNLPDAIVLGAVALAYGGAALAIDRFVGGIDWIERHRVPLLAVGFLVVFALQLLCVRELYSTHHWDPRAVFGAAIRLAEFNQLPMAVHTPAMYLRFGLPVSYWSRYPNNLPLVFVYEAVFRVCAAIGLSSPVYVSTCVNVLVLDVGVLLTGVCARRLWGRSAGRIALVIALPFLAFSPWISVAYSDTIATVFPILLLCLYMRYLDAAPRVQFLYAAAIGGVTALGYLFKPHVVAMTLAIGFVHALAPRSESPLIAKASKLVAVALAALMVAGAFGAYRDYRMKGLISKEQFAASAFPVTHLIAMSLGTELGGYNEADVTEESAIAGAEAKNERNIRVIKERLARMGPLGYAAFLDRKLRWMTTDGTFFWQSEASASKIEPIHRGAFARTLQAVLFRDGPSFRYYSLVASGMWLAILFSMVAPVATSRRFDTDRVLLVARASIIVLLLMLLVLEGRSRYLIAFMPVFVLLASYFLAGLSTGRVPRGVDRRASGT
jgi:hypothetical protein